MYKEFYGFITYPFSLTPDPQFLYLSKKHENCLHYLSYSLAQGHGIIVLTGKIGTGKTLILNILVKSLDEKTHKAYLVNSKLEFIDILKYISQAFGLEITGKSKIELLLNLEKFLLMRREMHEKAVVIIDEAQDLSVDVLEELRLLTNFESQAKKLLQIILVGQPQLENILKLPQLVQLAQRIGFNCQLFPMNYYETKGYIEKRLEVAGATYPIFTSRAIRKIFASSKGIPRVINLICDTALLFGSGDEKRKIGRAIIKQVMKEMNLYVPEKSLNYSPNQKRDAHESLSRSNTTHRDTTPLEYSVSSRGPEGMAQVEQRQSPRAPWRRGRVALAVGLISLSLLGAGFVLQSPWTIGKLREYTANAVSGARTVLSQSPGVREPPLLPHSSGVREPPLLPHSPSVHALPHQVQWVQTTVVYQFLTGKPLRVSLPQLRRTPEALPVRVTLDRSDSPPRWLNFDAEKLALSGKAPPQETGKTYYLTFRAHTADGLESLLQCVLVIR
jgi:general secretion pathway protein A